MEFLYNSIKSDFEKVKRQPLLIMHIVIPILAVIVFTVYYSHTHWKPTSKVSGFFQMAALIFPALIGVVSAMTTDQEFSAGKFQELLTSPMRTVTFLSKLLIILLLGLSAMLILVCGFSAALTYILHENPFGFLYYICAGFILFFSSIFIYVLHLIIGLKFGGTASIGLGIFETLLSALFNTGLGDGKWIFAPCTWGMRFMMNFHKFMIKDKDFLQNISELHLGIILCIVGTIVITTLTCLWFSKWEGQQSQ